VEVRALPTSRILLLLQKIFWSIIEADQRRPGTEDNEKWQLTMEMLGGSISNEGCHHEPRNIKLLRQQSYYLDFYFRIVVD
jgi:hypothetical protein